jgi:S1-C subfamily serine protease
VAVATVASVAVSGAVRSIKTTPATSPLAASADPGLVEMTATLGYQQAISAGTGMVLTPSGRVITNNHVIEGQRPSRSPTRATTAPTKR